LIASQKRLGGLITQIQNDMKKNYSHPEIKVFQVSVRDFLQTSREKIGIIRIGSQTDNSDARQSKNSMWDSFEVDDEE